MRITLFMIALLSVTTGWSTTEKKDKDVQPDSCLVISNKKGSLTIAQGKRVFVRVGDQKMKGIYRFASDSTIYVDSLEVGLRSIDMIAKPKTGKTVGMFFAQLPSSLFGFAIASLSWGFNRDALGASGGIAIIGVGLTGATLESYRGKRYRAYKHPKNTETKIRNWEYSVRRIQPI